MDSARAIASSGLFSVADFPAAGFPEATISPGLVCSAAFVKPVTEKPIRIPKALKVKTQGADNFHCLRMMSVSPKVR